MRQNPMASGSRATQVDPISRTVLIGGYYDPFTDFGSITVLWSQPVAALQIMSLDGKWRWVKHIDNALVSHPRGFLTRRMGD